jgi:hypothetical protein
MASTLSVPERVIRGIWGNKTATPPQQPGSDTSRRMHPTKPLIRQNAGLNDLDLHNSSGSSSTSMASSTGQAISVRHSTSASSVDEKIYGPSTTLLPATGQASGVRPQISTSPADTEIHGPSTTLSPEDHTARHTRPSLRPLPPRKKRQTEEEAAAMKKRQEVGSMVFVVACASNFGASLL